MDRDEEFEYAERPNKTAIKREMQVLREMGKQMIDLPAEKIQSLSIDDKLKAELIRAKSFSKGALRRQLIYIEKLMRTENADDIRHQLEHIHRPQKQETERFHQLEAWRDNLIANNSEVFEALLGEFPALDRQHIRQLIRNAQKELKANKPPKSSRALFRYLKENTG